MMTRMMYRATESTFAFPPEEIAASRFIPGGGDLSHAPVKQSSTAAAWALPTTGSARSTAQAPSFPPPRKTREIRAPTILVVDDDPDVLETTATLFIDAGYRVRHAYDGLLALWEIETQPPDLVLADVRMPRLDGIALAAQVNQRDPLIPVILMSATREAAPRQCPFIAKPCDINALLTIVDRILLRS